MAHPWEDVCVIIGAAGPSRTANGDKIPGARITVAEFARWLKVTLDINTPHQIIRTAQGDLIRDPSYQGQMYLKGLLLPSGGTSGHSYEKGYNFNDGNTTRERDSIAGSGEESKHIASIWAAAILEDGSPGSDVLVEYTTLLFKFLNKRGDTMISKDRNCLPEDIAIKIWKQMLVMHGDGNGRIAFYYPASEGKDVSSYRSLSVNPD